MDRGYSALLMTYAQSINIKAASANSRYYMFCKDQESSGDFTNNWLQFCTLLNLQYAIRYQLWLMGTVCSFCFWSIKNMNSDTFWKVHFLIFLLMWDGVGGNCIHKELSSYPFSRFNFLWVVLFNCHMWYLILLRSS